MTVVPAAVTWFVSEHCADDIKRIKVALGDDYTHNVAKLREMLCDYFSGDAGCSVPMGSSISTLGSADFDTAAALAAGYRRDDQHEGDGSL